MDVAKVAIVYTRLMIADVTIVSVGMHTKPLEANHLVLD